MERGIKKGVRKKIKEWQSMWRCQSDENKTLLRHQCSFGAEALYGIILQNNTQTYKLKPALFYESRLIHGTISFKSAPARIGGNSSLLSFSPEAGHTGSLAGSLRSEKTPWINRETDKCLTFICSAKKIVVKSCVLHGLNTRWAQVLQYVHNCFRPNASGRSL